MGNVKNDESFFFFGLAEHVAALDLTMVFLSLDMEPMKGRTTGWSKIPGEPTGEWKATS